MCDTLVRCNVPRVAANSQAPTGDATLDALIDRVARQHPQAPYLIDPETVRTMTYGELGESVAATSARLRQLNLSRGDRVCVAMHNGLPAVVGLLGAMSGGFVPVPVDPSSAPAQLEYILRHCEARAILIADERSIAIESITAACDLHIERVVLSIDAPSSREREQRSSLLPSGAAPDDDALLMYTSGSTGRPKGVLVSHGALVARVANSAAAHELATGDRLLCVLPLYHMSALNIVLAVLSSGGSMVMPSRFSVARYWDWVVSYRCTWLGVVPTIVAQLLRWSETHPAPARDALRGVRFARCSSAPLSSSAHRAFEERFGIVLVQGLGMTEAGSIFLNPPHRAQRKIGSLGRPCGVEVRVVGADGRELASGQIGELLVRGRSLMRGYYKDAEATATAIDAAGWLHTGDLGYRDADGYFFHAGRAKELIIKAGTNVAPREVDEALASHPDVAQAAAVGVQDPLLGEDIGAFVLLREGAHCSERALLDHCAARVGEFKTPSWITFVDALPTGPTGKVQRAQLAARAAAMTGAPDIDPQTPNASTEHGRVAPSTEVERVIAGVWTSVLERERIGVYDNFFELGGTSLTALCITALLRQSLGVHISLAALLDAPTIAAQAAVVVARRRAGAGGSVPAADGAAGDAGVTTATLLAPVAEHATRVPLFCVHDIGRFRQLAQSLGSHQPVYGVTVGPVIAAIASGQPTSTFSSYSIEDLARVCVPQIRRVQPVGPYRIAGFSFGGRIALEVAQQLRAGGEVVELLVILDTFMPGTFQPRPLQRLSLHLGKLLRVRSISRPAPDDADATAAMDHRYAEFRHQLRSRYQPQQFPGKVVLFRATARDDVAPRYRIDPRLGWGHIASGELCLHDVPGAHLEMLGERGTPIVAEALRRYLT